MAKAPKPSQTPYSQRPARAFWQTGVGGRTGPELADLWHPKASLNAETKIATFGSCFARHIGHHLSARGWAWLNAEPAPAFAPPDIAETYGYGNFSARTGNIYTTAALVQWLGWATGQPPPNHEYWPHNARWVDPFRGDIEPGGFASPDLLLHSRSITIAALRHAIEQADVFLFTLGQTEYWSNTLNGAVYQLCPGARGGVFDETQHIFTTSSVLNVLEELGATRSLLHEINPNLRLILSVSPVPLVATLRDMHVLSAAVHSKSVLHAAAVEFAGAHSNVDYFPSYELVSGPLAGPSRFDTGQRNVKLSTVDMVMAHFFATADTAPAPPPPKPIAQSDHNDCDEAYYAAFAPGEP